MSKQIPTVTIQVGVNHLLTSITEPFDVRMARERLFEYFRYNPSALTYMGEKYIRGTIIMVDIIAEFNDNVVCSEIFTLGDEILGERPYDEKFSNALTAMTIMQDCMVNAKSDIAFLNKFSKTDDTKYTKTKLKADFEELEKAFMVQHKYMLELTKELQKTYSMY